MNHKKGHKKINKPTDQRLALIRNLTYSLIFNSEIKTTLLRAKQTKSYCEKLMTLALKDDLHSIRQIFKNVNNKNFVKQIRKVSESYKNANGGYTSIIKCGLRKGDSAQMAILKLN